LKTETIQNQYDGPHAPVKQLPSSIVNLDYASSDDAFEIDAGIRETIKGLRLSILVMGMGLAKLKAKGLYVDLKFRSMNDYLESHNSRYMTAADFDSLRKKRKRVNTSFRLLLQYYLFMGSMS